jgi:DNA-binding NtrC family response regulator
VHDPPPHGAQTTDPLSGGERAALPETLWLVVLVGPDRGKEVALTRGTYLVGKDLDCALVLTDPTVSRQHLKIDVRPDELQVTDLGSRNGSFFAGARFQELSVSTGAILAIGESTLGVQSRRGAQDLLPSSSNRFGELHGGSLPMRRVFALLERVAVAESPVLIEGETGTGKDVCARALHAGGARRGSPFVVCDLAAVSESLIESELYGHRRGAFTGADRDRQGAFAAAHGGTLFVDEVGELALPLQPRLLRAIERGEVKPLGESAYRRVDVRLIAATNRSLDVEVAEKRFRSDLFHRLAVVRITLPPLRERREDIPLLVSTMFADRAVDLAPDALALLSEYHWPGNVRELKNVIEGALARRRPGERVEPHLLGWASPEPIPPTATFHEAKERLVATWEERYLRELLQRHGGNVSGAARTAGLSRVHLHELMKKRGVDR